MPTSIVQEVGSLRAQGRCRELKAVKSSYSPVQTSILQDALFNHNAQHQIYKQTDNINMPTANYEDN